MANKYMSLEKAFEQITAARLALTMNSPRILDAIKELYKALDSVQEGIKERNELNKTLHIIQELTNGK